MIGDDMGDAWFSLVKKLYITVGVSKEEHALMTCSTTYDVNILIKILTARKLSNDRLWTITHQQQSDFLDLLNKIF